jgi:LysR family cys regulon transcriptional activator
VRQLETAENLNVRLLRSRGVKGVELTEAGRRLHRLLSSVFRPIGEVVAELRAEDVGEINVGLSNYASFNYLPEILAPFRQRFPRVSMRLRVGETDDVLGWLEKSECDIGICPPPQSYHSLVIPAVAPMPVALLVPPGHRLTRGRVTWERLLEDPIVVFDRSTSLRHSMESLFTHLGIFGRLEIAAEVSRVDLATAAVRAGLGAAVTPMGPAYRKLAFGLKKLQPPPGLHVANQAVIYREDRYVPQYMQGFVDVAVATLRGLNEEAGPLARA